jgi:hypothetical protein
LVQTKGRNSVVKLYVAEPGSQGVRALVERATVVATSQIAYPEAHAALARRRRERALAPRAFAAAKRQLEADWPKYLAIQVTEALCKNAGSSSDDRLNAAAARAIRALVRG